MTQRTKVPVRMMIICNIPHGNKWAGCRFDCVSTYVPAFMSPSSESSPCVDIREPTELVIVRRRRVCTLLHAAEIHPVLSLAAEVVLTR